MKRKINFSGKKAMFIWFIYSFLHTRWDFFFFTSKMPIHEKNQFIWWIYLNNDDRLSIQFSSVAQYIWLFVTPWTATCQELARTHVHWVDDTTQASHPLSSSSLSAFNLSQHQGLFQWANSSHQVAKVLEFQLQHQSFRWIFRTNFL